MTQGDRPLRKDSPSETKSFQESKSPVESRETRPTSLGRFELRSVLGRGAFGIVYRAWDPQLKRDVAIKVLHGTEMEGSDSDSAFLDDAEKLRFKREAEVAARVSHPNICQVYEVGETAGRCYIVMACVEGKSLAQVLKSRGKLKPRQAATLVRKLALALAEAHSHNIVHRDVKPGNIMIDKKGQPMLMDFGLARSTHANDVQLTQSGMAVGTPAYMAPEQACGNSKQVGPHVDLFSLGVVLFELLTGQRPFSGTPDEVIGKIASEAVVAPSPKTFESDLPDALESICAKCLSKTVLHRYGSALELAAELGSYLTATRDGSEDRSVDTQANAVTTAKLDAIVDALNTERESRKKTFGLVAAAGLSGLLIVFMALTWVVPRFVTTGQGTITLELDVELQQPGITVWLDDKEIDTDRLGQPMELDVGQHQVEVRRNGSVVFAKRFQVSGGINANLKLVDSSQKQIQPHDDSSAARMLADAACLVTIQVPVGDPVPISDPGQIPAQACSIIGIEMGQDVDINDELLDTISELRHLIFLSIHDQNGVDDDSLVELRKGQGLQQLQKLSLSSTSVSETGIGTILEGLELEELDLSRCAIGDAVAAIARLNSLRSLALRESGISGDSLAHLASLHSLEFLDVSTNELQDEFLEPLRNLEELKTLVISRCNLTNAAGEHLQHLGSLETLDISHNAITNEFCDDLNPLESLEHLKIGGTDLHDRIVAILSKLTSLQSIDLTGTFIGRQAVDELQRQLPTCVIKWDPSAVRQIDRRVARNVLDCGGQVSILDRGALVVLSEGDLPGQEFQLTRIMLDEECDLDDLAIYLWPGLTRLDVIDAAGSRIQDQDLRWIGESAGLIRLSLNSTDISDAGLTSLRNLSRLKELDVRGTDIDGTGLKELAACPLKRLSIGEHRSSAQDWSTLPRLEQLEELVLTGISFVQIEESVSQAMPWLRHLSCDTATDADMEEIGRWKQVRELDLSESDVTDAALDRLRVLAELEALGLGYTRISGAGLGDLAANRKLQRLDLAGTGFSEVGLQNLSRLRGLREINLVRSAFDNASLAALQPLTRLERVDLSQSRVTDGAIRRFQRERPRCKVESDPLPQGDIDRLAAELFHNKGAIVKVELSTTRQVQIDAEDPLPKEKFSIVEIRAVRTPIPIDDGDLRWLQGTQSLRLLEIERGTVTDQGLANLQELQELKSVAFSFLDISDKTLAYLSASKKMDTIRLYETRISNRGLLHLRHFPEVSYLDVAQCSEVTEDFLPMLTPFRQLQRLNLGFIPQRPENLRAINSIAKLRILGFAECPAVTESDLYRLSQRVDLTQLAIRYSALEPNAFRRLNAFRNLEQLNLERTRFEDKDLYQLGKMTNLSILVLNGPSIGDQSVEALESLKRLRKLELIDTRISPSKRDELVRALPNCDIVFKKTTHDL